MAQDINVVALVKGEERYIFLFNDGQKSETLRTLGRYASDSKLSFSWYDAAVLSQKVRNIEQAQSNIPQEPNVGERTAGGSSVWPEPHFDHDMDWSPSENLFPEEDWF